MPSDPAHIASQAGKLVGFVAQRNAPKTEPLDELDWQNIMAAAALLRALPAVLPVNTIPAVSSPPGPAAGVEPRHTPPIYSAAGVTIALRQIHHRGHLVPGDMDTIHAAIRLLESEVG